MRLRSAVTWVLLAAASTSGASTRGRAHADGVLTAAELSSLRAGQLVTKVVDTEDRTEVMSVAAFHAPIDVGPFLDLARSARGFGRSEDSLGEGRLSMPPTVADFAALHLGPRDLAYLSRCHQGDCHVRLTSTAISRFERNVEWSANQNAATAEAAFREMLVGEAAAYLAEGQLGLRDYADGPNAVGRAQGLSELLRRPFYLLEGAPELSEYLRAFPSARPQLVDEFLVWRQDRFWTKPVIGLYHVAIWKSSEAGEERILVATKQFYASHYLESAVDLLEFRKGASDALAELTFVSRVRADIRPAGFNWLERTLLRHLVRGRLESQFESVRERLAPRKGGTHRAASTRSGKSIAF